MNDLSTSSRKMFTTCEYLRKAPECQWFSRSRRNTGACNARPCRGKGGLERGVDVDKLASFLPGAQGDSTLGVLCCIHNGVQFDFRGLRHGGIGHALLKVRQAFFASILDL